jgi:hypothetical protein
MLPARISRFLRSAIRSIWDLEVLLLLYRDRTRLWTADALVHELRASALIVSGALAVLQRAGLVAKSGEGFRYWAATPDLDHLVEDVAAAYASAPAAVTEAILSAPNANVQIFSDAFKFKKD